MRTFMECVGVHTIYREGFTYFIEDEAGTWAYQIKSLDEARKLARVFADGAEIS